MEANETAGGGGVLSSVSPLLQSKLLRIALVTVPAILVMVAIVSAAGGGMVVAAVLNLFAGIIVSTVLFFAVTLAARQEADYRVLFAQNAQTDNWRSRAGRLLSIRDRDTSLYADWYFRLRLQEELERAERYTYQVTVIIAKSGDGDAEQEARRWQQSDVRDHLRRSDLPAILRDGSLGVILPNTSRSSTLKGRLMKSIASASAQVGVACYPEDGPDVSNIMRFADEQTRIDTPTHETPAEPETSVA
jgi:hypothetical protein